MFAPTTFLRMKIVWIVCCIAGIVIPFRFALPFFRIHGPNFRLFVEEIFATRTSSSFAADLLLASVILLAWSRRANRRPARADIFYFRLFRGVPDARRCRGNRAHLSRGARLVVRFVLARDSPHL